MNNEVITEQQDSDFQASFKIINMRKQSKNKSMFSKKCKCQKIHNFQNANNNSKEKNVSSSSIDSQASENSNKTACKTDFNLSDSLSKAFFNFFPEGVAFIDSSMNLLYANDSLYKFFQSDQYDLLEKLYQLQNDLQVNELQMQKSQKAQNFILNNIVRTDQHIQTPTNKYSVKMKSSSNIMQPDIPQVYRKFSAIPVKHNSTQNNIQIPNIHTFPLGGQSTPQNNFNHQRTLNSFITSQLQQVTTFQSKNSLTNQNTNCQTPNNHDGSQYQSQFANYILQSNNNTPNMRQKSNTTLPFNSLNRNTSINTQFVNQSNSNFHNGSIFFQAGSKKNITDEQSNQTPQQHYQFSKSDESIFTNHYPVQDSMNHINIQKKQAISRDLRQEIDLILQEANVYLQQNQIESDCILDKSFTFTSRIVFSDLQKQESLAHQGFFSNNQIAQNMPQLPMYKEQKASISEKLMKEESMKSRQLTKENSIFLQQQSSQFTPIQTSLSKNVMVSRNSMFNSQSQLLNQNNLNSNFIMLASQNKERLSDQRLNHHYSSNSAKQGKDQENEEYTAKEQIPITQSNIYKLEKRQTIRKMNSGSSDKMSNGLVTFEQTELKPILSCQEGDDFHNKSNSPSHLQEKIDGDETIDLINLEEHITTEEDIKETNIGNILVNGSPSSIYQMNQKTMQSNSDKVGSLTAIQNFTQKSNCSINIQQQISQNNQLQPSPQSIYMNKKQNTLHPGSSGTPNQYLSQQQQHYTSNSVTQNNQSSQTEFYLQQDQSKLSSSPNWISNSNHNTSLTVNNNINININNNQKNIGIIQQHLNQKGESISPAIPMMTESHFVQKQDLLKYTNQSRKRKTKYSLSNELLNNEMGTSINQKCENSTGQFHQQQTNYQKRTVHHQNIKNSSYRINDNNNERANVDKNEIDWSEEEDRRNTREVDITIFTYILNQQPVILLLVRDVTHRSYIKLLQDVSKKKSKMVSFVSHELRTPLNSIIAMLETMKNKPDIDYIETALMNSKYLLCISNDLLDLAQIKVNKFQIRKKTFNLKELVMESLEMFQIQAERQHIDLVVDYPSDMRSFVTSDKNRIRQVLINLLGNAFKFTLTGSIKIKVELDNNALFQVHVIDTGIGIKEADLNKLFKTFGKLDGEESVKLNEQGRLFFTINVINSQ